MNEPIIDDYIIRESSEEELNYDEFENTEEPIIKGDLVKIKKSIDDDVENAYYITMFKNRKGIVTNIKTSTKNKQVCTILFESKREGLPEEEGFFYIEELEKISD